jgi:hypothetical protein
MVINLHRTSDIVCDFYTTLQEIIRTNNKKTPQEIKAFLTTFLNYNIKITEPPNDPRSLEETLKNLVNIPIHNRVNISFDEMMYGLENQIPLNKLIHRHNQAIERESPLLDTQNLPPNSNTGIVSNNSADKKQSLLKKPNVERKGGLGN